MPHGITAALITGLTAVVTHFGYTGVCVAMAISAVIPIPSEAIMPFAGKEIVVHHLFNFHLLAIVGAFGNLFGSMAGYAIGFYGGRPFVEKYGRYLLIRRHDIDVADSWFQRHGEATVFWTRMMPVIRAFISLPAGIARMAFARFCFYTFLGGLVWSYLLTYAGYKLGEHWEKINRYMHTSDTAILAVLVLLVAIWVYRHTRPEPEAKNVETSAAI